MFSKFGGVPSVPFVSLVFLPLVTQRSKEKGTISGIPMGHIKNRGHKSDPVPQVEIRGVAKAPSPKYFRVLRNILQLIPRR